MASIRGHRTRCERMPKMNLLVKILSLAALVLTVELAILVHAKFGLSTAFNVDDRVKGPSLFRPRWRLGVYAIYLVGGIAAVEGLVQRFVGFVLIVLPILLLVILDLIALRRIIVSQTRKDY